MIFKENNDEKGWRGRMVHLHFGAAQAIGKVIKINPLICQGKSVFYFYTL